MTVALTVSFKLMFLTFISYWIHALTSRPYFIHESVVSEPSSCGRSNTLRTMRMTSSKCVLQQRHLLGYESEP